MKLDDFFRTQRAAFDNREPSSRVWENIERAVFARRTPWYSAPVWRFAAAILLMVSAFWLGLYWPQGVVSRGQTREMTELKHYYQNEIAKKTALISTYANRLDEDRFSDEQHKLEAMYLVLEEELRRRPSPEVRDALVLTLLLRIDLLNQQIERLEDTMPRDTTSRGV